MSRPLGLLAVLSLTAAVPALLPAAQEVDVTTIPVADGVSMLMGKGGNVGVVVGEQGVLMIDSQFADMTGKLTAAVGALTDRPVKYLLNTHWHFDHTGGNENLGKAGVVVVAHDNVLARMSVDQEMPAFDRTVEAAPDVARPVITFADEATFHLAGKTLRCIHVANAHTDGDVIVHDVEDDVFHAGDTFFNGFYPFIDAGSGGGIDGMIAADDVLLGLADADSKIIPGHGPLGTKAELRAFRDMLATVAERVHGMLAAGKSKEQIVAAKPTADLDAEWGDGFMAPDDWVGIVVDGIVARTGK
ncbi:MAG: MBL fold metallo-hydrolase [Planctomycetes bacterium]|nr:MBL fold metallo-hydrolase [Planctomycetota bacterium]